MESRLSITPPVGKMWKEQITEAGAIGGRDFCVQDNFHDQSGGNVAMGKLSVECGHLRGTQQFPEEICAKKRIVFGDRGSQILAPEPDGGSVMDRKIGCLGRPTCTCS